MHLIGTRTREMIAAEAKVVTVGGHMCKDRDWCDTTGPSGCGAKDDRLAELRAEWKGAVTEIVVTACELIDANRKWGQVFYQRGFHESLTMGKAHELAKEMGIAFAPNREQRDLMVNRAVSMINEWNISLDEAQEIARIHIKRRTQARLASIRAKRANA